MMQCRPACILALLLLGPAPEGSGQEQSVLPRTVLLDNFYNSEWKKDSTGSRRPYHYLWHDSANSGYSILRRIITRLGAEVDTLCRPPSREALRRAGLYMIVDPDTPRETEAPNTIGNEAAEIIAAWVHAGGVLVLLGNDRANAEFEHLNALAERFGIRFNEDSRNGVVRNDYRTGTFNHFPDHPVFRGVRRIFIKELSTLAVHEPAVPVLVEGDDVIMAEARYGAGSVFAVGDPWFYDEYMDERRLPADYDNPLAAENLFRYLMRDLPLGP